MQAELALTPHPLESVSSRQRELASCQRESHATRGQRHFSTALTQKSPLSLDKLKNFQSKLKRSIQDPIKGGDVRDKWDQYKGVGVALDDPYENYRRNKSYSFIARMKARDECK